MKRLLPMLPQTFLGLTSLASSLATKVQTSVVNAAKDFERERQEMIERNKAAGASEEKPTQINLPPVSVADLRAVPSKVTQALANLPLPGSSNNKAAESAETSVLINADSPAVNDDVATVEGKNLQETRASDSTPTVTIPSSTEIPPEQATTPASSPSKPKKVAELFDSPSIQPPQPFFAAATGIIKKTQNIIETVDMPWSGLEDNAALSLRKQILALSQETRNFLVNPPEGTDFTFDMTKNLSLAMALLKIDPQLEQMRFQLVPKQIKDEIFWRNYFYRVSLLRQSATLLDTSSSSPVKDALGATPALVESLPTAQDLVETAPEPTQPLSDLGDSEDYATEEFNGDWEKELQEELNSA